MCRAGLEAHPLHRLTVFTVLLHLKNELNRGDFFMTLRNQPMALSLYRQVSAHEGEERVGAFVDFAD